MARAAARQKIPDWAHCLGGNPLPWLLDDDTPAVRHAALRQLLDRDEDDSAVRRARAAAMKAPPISAILAAQSPEGYWDRPGHGYTPKYRATVWQLIFLDQLSADPRHRQVRAGCEYALAHAQADCGGFAASGALDGGNPPSSRAYHCINGNLLSAFIAFGYLGDERVQRAIDWEARAITGEHAQFFASGTSGPGFACGVNEQRPCGWGAIKALRALARIPVERRSPLVRRAIRQGVEFLLSRDPAVADYPMIRGNTKPSSSWFRLGFPSGYVADVLQNLEVLCELGRGGDRRIEPAIRWVLSKQDALGRWRNEYAYNGRTWVNIEKQGQPSKWVTLRACRVLKLAQEAGNRALQARIRDSAGA